MYKVGIIGAGICGLNTAMTLHRNQIEFKIFDSSNKPGGCIKSLYEFNSIIEAGPNSINGKNKDIYDLIDYLSIEKKCCYANKNSQNRYILKNGKPVAVPISPNQIITNKILSLSTKLKILTEIFIKSKTSVNESVEEFILRRFNQEFLDYIINPFINGIYAGDPAKLSISKAFPKLVEIEEKYGSIIKGFVNLKKNQSHVVFTQPAYTFETLRSSLDLSFLNDIYYSPVTSVSLLYNKKQFKKDIDGFGLLIPECENKFILGVLFPSIIFPNRCPNDKILLTVFVGGAIHPDRALLNKDDLIKNIERDLSDFLNLEGNSEHFKIVRWEKAIPQYETDINDVHKQIEQIENEQKNIFFGGNYIGGISLPNAISTGKNIGEKIVKDVKNRKVF